MKSEDWPQSWKIGVSPVMDDGAVARRCENLRRELQAQSLSAKTAKDGYHPEKKS